MFIGGLLASSHRVRTPNQTKRSEVLNASSEDILKRSFQVFLLNFTNLKKYLNFFLLLIFTTKVSLAKVNEPSYLYKEFEGLSEKDHALLLDVGDDLRCPTCTGF